MLSINSIVNVLTTSSDRRTYKDVNNQTLLHIAVEQNEIDYIYPLVEKDGLNPDAQDYKGETALLHAAKLGCDHFILKLFEVGANVDCYDNSDDSALLWAIYNGYVSTSELLLLLGADPYHKYSDDRDAFGWAIYRSNHQILQYLLEYYPALSMNHIDRKGLTWRMLAISEEIRQIITKFQDKNKLYLFYWGSRYPNKLLDTHVLKFLAEFYC